jgi:hypothetical protein
MSTNQLGPGFHQRQLRILLSGTLFLTNALGLDSFPSPGSVSRSHSVTKTRGGSAATVASILAQFSGTEPYLNAALGGNDEAKLVHRRMEREGVILQYCKLWSNASIPTAWVLDTGQPDLRAVINHNPLPDITHEEFISILGPALAPENYPTHSATGYSSQSRVHGTSNTAVTASPSRPSTASSPNPSGQQQSPAPFDWFHFEGRSVRTTLSNITGVEGLARERKWRSHSIFSVDIGRRARQGVEVLIPYADVIFLTKSYAASLSPHYASSPRSFLLSMSAKAPPHALLIAHWGNEGNAVLSLPTREYFQSSRWVNTDSNRKQASNAQRSENAINRLSVVPTVSDYSVQSGSDYYAGGRGTPSSTDHTTPSPSAYNTSRGGSGVPNSDSGAEQESHQNEMQPQPPDPPRMEEPVLDEVGAQDAFIAGMIFSLSRRLVPDPNGPYTPGGESKQDSRSEEDRSLRWKLDECLRFATELSGRKAERVGWDGLGAEMVAAGWFHP